MATLTKSRTSYLVFIHYFEGALISDIK